MSETPTTTPSPATVTDHRPVPRGVLPRGIQTWVMLAVAGGMMAIIFAVGRPNPPARQATVASTAPVPSPDRVHDYQERLKAAEAQVAQHAQAAALTPVVSPQATNDMQPVPTQDPLKAERKRR